MLNTIYETGYDLHVANYVAYLHTDKKLYEDEAHKVCLLYTSPSPRDPKTSRMPSSA